MCKFRIQLIKLTCLTIFVAFTLRTPIAFGRSKDVPTAFIKAAGGLATYKSKMVESNDTSTMIEYSLGAYAGSNRQLGTIIRRDQNTTAFSLNEAKIFTYWQDVIIQYRWGPFYIGAVLGSAQFKASTADSDQFLDGRGEGYGGNLGLDVPFGKLGKFKLDVLSVTNNQAVELNQKEFTVGQRMDIDMGASFDITRHMLDFIIGYKQRSFTLGVEGNSYKEAITATYLGVCFESFF